MTDYAVKQDDFAEVFMGIFGSTMPLGVFPSDSAIRVAHVMYAQDFATTFYLVRYLINFNHTRYASFLISCSFILQDILNCRLSLAITTAVSKKASVTEVFFEYT